MNILTLAIFVASFVAYIDAHGSLFDPPARSSAWRFDNRFTKPYYQDMEMFCGGVNNQWQNNGGKCGICGDPYQGPRRFEKGGDYYTGQIVATYRKGGVVNVHVDIATNHLGWFEFRICNVDGLQTDATQECLDKTVLKDASGVSRFLVGGYEGEKRAWRKTLVLPSGLECKHCVFQWKYNTGNRHGNDETTGEWCYGCGPGQEQFYGCSDVAIVN